MQLKLIATLAAVAACAHVAVALAPCPEYPKKCAYNYQCSKFLAPGYYGEHQPHYCDVLVGQGLDSGGGGECRRAAYEGDACDANQECVTNRCRDGHCKGYFCETFAANDNLLGQFQQRCFKNFSCADASLVCNGARCVPHTLTENNQGCSKFDHAGSACRPGLECLLSDWAGQFACLNFSTKLEGARCRLDWLDYYPAYFQSEDASPGTTIYYTAITDNLRSGCVDPTHSCVASPPNETPFVGSNTFNLFGHCSPPRAVSESCFRDSDCASGFCYATTISASSSDVFANRLCQSAAMTAGAPCVPATNPGVAAIFAYTGTHYYPMVKLPATIFGANMGCPAGTVCRVNGSSSFCLPPLAVGDTCVQTTAGNWEKVDAGCPGTLRLSPLTPSDDSDAMAKALASVSSDPWPLCEYDDPAVPTVTKCRNKLPLNADCSSQFMRDKCDTTLVCRKNTTGGPLQCFPPRVAGEVCYDFNECAAGLQCLALNQSVPLLDSTVPVGASVCTAAGSVNETQPCASHADCAEGLLCTACAKQFEDSQSYGVVLTPLACSVSEARQVCLNLRGLSGSLSRGDFETATTYATRAQAPSACDPTPDGAWLRGEAERHMLQYSHCYDYHVYDKNPSDAMKNVDQCARLLFTHRAELLTLNASCGPVLAAWFCCRNCAYSRLKVSAVMAIDVEQSDDMPFIPATGDQLDYQYGDSFDTLGVTVDCAAKDLVARASPCCGTECLITGCAAFVTDAIGGTVLHGVVNAGSGGAAASLDDKLGRAQSAATTVGVSATLAVAAAVAALVRSATW